MPDYLSFIFNRSLWDVFDVFLLTLARLVPIIAIAPFLGGKMISDPMKVGFGVALVPIFLPFLLLQHTVHLTHDLYFLLLILKEIFVGATLGFIATFPFYICQGAGSLIDHQRGSQSLQVTDPSTQVQSSPIGLLLNNVMIVIFFQVGGPLLFFDALFTSYQIVPPDQFINPLLFGKAVPFWHTMISLINTMIVITVQLAAPSVMAMMMSDLFLGIANRMAPQVQISFLLWSLKAYVGIGILWVGWWFVFKQLNHEGLAWLKMTQGLMDGLKAVAG